MGQSLWEAIEQVEASPLSGAAVASVTRFRELIQGLRERAAEASVADLLEEVLAKSGYMEMLEADRTIEAQGRMENLQELVGVAREYESRGEEGGRAAGWPTSCRRSRSTPTRTAWPRSGRR